MSAVAATSNADRLFTQILGMAVRAGLINGLADFENPVLVARLRGLERIGTRRGHVARGLRPVAVVERAAALQQQRGRLDQHRRRRGNLRPVLVSAGLLLFRALL